MCKALYTDLDIEYQQAYSGPYQDLRCDDLVIAQKDGILSGFGRPVIGDNLKEFERLYGIYRKVWYMDYLEDCYGESDTNISEISRFLLKEGLEPKPYYTQVIDLTNRIDVLHKDMRKSYQNLANEYNPDISFFLSYEMTHKKVFGDCRNQKTYDIQRKMWQEEKAFVVSFQNKYASGLFYVNNHCCYYASGPSMPDISMHPIIWKAIQHAKELGCTKFEMGQQVYTGDQKAINISSFKRGFGGSTKVRLEFKNC